MPRVCVTAIPSYKGGMIGIVIEDEAGYSPTGWFFPTLEAAEKYAEEYNGKLGLTRLEAWTIVATSMRKPRDAPSGKWHPLPQVSQ